METTKLFLFHCKSFSAAVISALQSCLVLTLFLLPFSAQAQEKITIGLVPEMNVFAQVQRFQPLADHLTRETGIEIHLSILNRYSSMFEEIRSEKIDAAFLGSFTAALVIAKLNAVPVARPVNLDKTSSYHGIIFVRKDSGIKTAEQMRGKTMVFVERATTAGYIFPLAWLKKQMITDHTTFFKDYYFAGSHDAAINAVLNGKADVGAAKNTIYDLYLKRNSEAAEKLEILARSIPVPSNGLCVSSSISSETIAKLQSALIGLDKTPGGKEVLQRLHALKFVKTKTDDYTPVLNLLHEAGISLESYAVNR